MKPTEDTKDNWTVIRKEEIDKTLKSKSADGTRLLEPLKSLAAAMGLPINILEEKKVLRNDAEVHKHESDLWHCLEGEITFKCDGELADGKMRKNQDGTDNKNELYSPEIMGGVETGLKKGDWLFIPEGIPHAHYTKTSARLLIIKIPAGKKADKK